MEETKTIGTSGNSLIEGLTNSYINNYIITSNPNEIINAGDTGDIIVFVSNGKGIFSQDKEKPESNITPYTDIYIGNEHIAGGFGFKDIKTRENVLTDITRIEEKADTYYDVLNTEISQIRESKENPIGVHEGKRFIRLDNGDEYELSITSNNILYYTKHHRITVNDIEILYYLNNDMEGEPFVINKNTKDLKISVFDTVQVVGLNIVTETSDDILRIDLHYIAPNFDDNIGTKEGKLTTVGKYTDYNLVYKIHEENFENKTAPGEEKYVWLERFSITFDEAYSISAKDHMNYDFQFRVDVKTDRYDSATLYTPPISFTHPIFYYNDVNNLFTPIYESSGLNEIDNVKIGEDNLITINHGTTPSYGCILVPYYFVDDLYNIDFYYEDQLIIRTDFDLFTDIEINNSEVFYKPYRTPNKYMGEIKWRFKLTPKYI